VGKEVSWEDGKNRTFEALGPRFSLDVRCLWGDTRNTDVHAHELQKEQPAFRELSSLLSMDHAAAEEAALKAQRKEREQQQQQQQQAASSNGYSSGSEVKAGGVGPSMHS
jgi:hypothetical protein